MKKIILFVSIIALIMSFSVISNCYVNVENLTPFPLYFNSDPSDGNIWINSKENPVNYLVPRGTTIYTKETTTGLGAYAKGVIRMKDVYDDFNKTCDIQYSKYNGSDSEITISKCGFNYSVNPGGSCYATVVLLPEENMVSKK